MDLFSPDLAARWRVQSHDPAETISEHSPKALGRCAVVAQLLCRKLRGRSHRPHPPLYRAAESSTLKDAFGVRAILPRPEGRGLVRVLIKLNNEAMGPSG